MATKYVFGFLLVISTFPSSSNAQQWMGVGTLDPQERLDINGNLRITGQLNANGSVGQPGQVLVVNNGSMSWQTISKAAPFSRMTYYSGPTTPGASGSNFSWTVPSGVTQAMVEIWGGGGGGSANGDGSGGGGAGAYSRGVINLTGVTSLTLSVGGAGRGNNISANGGNGSPSSVSWTRLAVNYRIESGGGMGAGRFGGTGVDAGYAGAGGAINPANTIVPSDMTLFQLPGAPGSPTSFDFFQAPEDLIHYQANYGGWGGLSFPHSSEFQAKGAFFAYNPNLSSTIDPFGTEAARTTTPGGGGAGPGRSSSAETDYAGAPGLIILRW